MRARSALVVLSAVLGLLLAARGAVEALACARPVAIVTVFAGAFGAGAALVAAVYQHRLRQERVRFSLIDRRDP
jgi:hypothetical protein